ncbi:MAG: orotidine-5'-phosphate decarboxylase [Gammaproteobacteria bacterium]
MYSGRTQGSRLIVALDFPTAQTALALADRLLPPSCRIKIGQELFTRAGPPLVETLQRRGFEIFLDLKYHDIPNTVAGACRAAAELGVWMVDVHAQGGQRMLEAACNALSPYRARPLLVAVTVLTSLDAQELTATGIPRSPAEQALALGRSACAAGLDGVVCSAWEAHGLRVALGTAPCLVTPGIRSINAGADDQRRTMTAAAAIRAGADYLVIGRPITHAPDPLAALEAFRIEMNCEIH